VLVAWFLGRAMLEATRLPRGNILIGSLRAESVRMTKRSRPLPAILRQRRGLQFGTTALFVGMAIAAVVAFLVREKASTPLEGAWRDTGKQAGCRLIVHFDRLTLLSNGRSETFRFELEPVHDQIDLYGASGIQLGIYALPRDRLQLQLAYPGERRPNHFQAAPNPQSQFYEFERAP
jgi:hypothetical protein